MYKSRCRSLSSSKNFLAARCTSPCRSPQKLSFKFSTKCWKCSVIGVIFAMGVSLLSRIRFPAGQAENQLTPSCLLHNQRYVTFFLYVVHSKLPRNLDGAQHDTR